MRMSPLVDQWGFFDIMGANSHAIQGVACFTHTFDPIVIGAAILIHLLIPISYEGHTNVEIDNRLTRTKLTISGIS